jgi:hypothetical protein
LNGIQPNIGNCVCNGGHCNTNGNTNGAIINGNISGGNISGNVIINGSFNGTLNGNINGNSMCGNLYESMYSNLYRNLCNDMYPNLYANLYQSIYASLYGNTYANLRNDLYSDIYGNIYDICGNVCANLCGNSEGDREDDSTPNIGNIIGLITSVQCNPIETYISGIISPSNGSQPTTQYGNGYVATHSTGLGVDQWTFIFGNGNVVPTSFVVCPINGSSNATVAIDSASITPANVVANTAASFYLPIIVSSKPTADGFSFIATFPA